MSILAWIIIGGLAGWIASLIIRRGSNQGVLLDIVLGIIGAIVGGFLMNLLGQPGVTGFNVYSLLVAVLGAVVLIWVGRALNI